MLDLCCKISEPSLLCVAHKDTGGGIITYWLFPQSGKILCLQAALVGFDLSTIDCSLPQEAGEKYSLFVYRRIMMVFRSPTEVFSFSHCCSSIGISNG